MVQCQLNNITYILLTCIQVNAVVKFSDKNFYKNQFFQTSGSVRNGARTVDLGFKRFFCQIQVVYQLDVFFSRMKYQVGHLVLKVKS